MLVGWRTMWARHLCAVNATKKKLLPEHKWTHIYRMPKMQFHKWINQNVTWEKIEEIKCKLTTLIVYDKLLDNGGFNKPYRNK